MHSLHPFLRLATATAAVVTLTLTAAAGPSHAAPREPAPQTASCSVSTSPVVTTTGPHATVSMRLGSSCPFGSTATWRVVSPTGGDVTRVTLSGRRAKPVKIPTTNAASLGRYRLVPVSGADAANGLMYLAPGSVTVKAGSRLSAGVSGSRVAVTATRYDMTTRAQRPWSGAVVTAQAKTCTGASCTWTTVGSTRTNAAGRAAVTRPADARAFRVLTAPTSQIGGRTATAR